MALKLFLFLTIAFKEIFKVTVWGLNKIYILEHKVQDQIG